MKVNKIVALILLLEFVYFFFVTTSSIITYFVSSSFVLYAITYLFLFLLLISSVGLFMNKKWAVVFLWLFILLPLVLTGFTPLLLFFGGYHFMVLNTIIATYFTVLSFPKKLYFKT